MFRIARVFGRSIRSLSLVVLLISTLSAAVLGGYAMGNALQPATALFTVNDPIEVLDYPSAFSLYPGETMQFNVTVQNLASVNYSVVLSFSLNDTEYQADYVTFSNERYTLAPGTQTLAAWLTVSANASPANLQVTITCNISAETPPTPTAEPSSLPSPTKSPEPSLLPDESPTPSPSPSYSPSPTPLPAPELSSSLTLLGAGARWAARNGTSALYVSWKDNWAAHGKTDGTNWGPWPSQETMDEWQASVSQALEQNGFNVTLAGDIPQNLTGYDVVVIFAYWAVEPKHAALIKDYVSNGGSVVILGGVPCYFTVTCKDWWTYMLNPNSDLNSIQEWFGARYYVNAGGNVTTTVNNPFGTSILNGTIIISGAGYSSAAVTSLDSDAQAVAVWNSGFGYGFQQAYSLVFAFTHEYGQGRVYYQAGT